MIGYVGRYRILRSLGEGGMGRLFLAELAGAGGFLRRVVLKVVRDERDAGLVEALLAEARLGAVLLHRNIVAVLGLEEIGQRRLLVLEHVDGMDLGVLLDRRGRLPWPTVAFVASEVAAALDYAYRRRDDAGRALAVVHRDVSPPNVLLSWEGEVKLGDFGVAAAGDERSPDGPTGRYGYMAPEQARGAPVDARSDVFSLGVLMAAALTGERPRRAEGDLAVPPEAAERRVPVLPPEVAPPALAAIVARATARDPEARYPTAAALREALLALDGRQTDPARELSALLREARPRAAVRAALGEAGIEGTRRTQPALRAVSRRPVRPFVLAALLVVTMIAAAIPRLTAWRDQARSAPPATAPAAAAPIAAPAPTAKAATSHAAHGSGDGAANRPARRRSGR